MNPSLYIITLAVDDLDRASTFYQNGIGLVKVTDSEDLILFKLHGEITLALLKRSEFNALAGQNQESIAQSSSALSFRVENEKEVDELLNQAVDAGGTITSQVQAHEWGYNGYLKDPDGHLLEIVTFFGHF